MSQAPAGASGLVRVTVASGTRRVDLVLPAAVPVAELVPELARSVGLLDPTTVHGGYHLVTPEGRRLEGDAGLTMQGVEDGGVLTVTAGVDDAPRRVYDDVVEAMADVVERDLRPWRPEAGRRTALGAGVLLLGLGAVALLLQDGDAVAAVAAVAVAVVLGAGGVVLSRAQEEPEAAVTVAWMSVVYAVVAGLLLVPEGASLFGVPVAAAGGAALVAGSVALVGIDDGRTLLLPAVVLGAVGLTGGLLMDAVAFRPQTVYTAALVVVVLSASVFPWLALGATGTRVQQVATTADITAEPRDVDAADVGTDARLAHEILVAVTATVGILTALVAPLAVDLGLSGTLLALACCATLVLRTRQYRAGTAVLVGVVAGIAGLVSTAAAVMVLHEAWRPALAVSLAVGGALVLAATLVPAGSPVRRGRLGDVAETVCLVSLLPLLVVAVGLFSAAG